MLLWFTDHLMIETKFSSMMMSTVHLTKVYIENINTKDIDSGSGRMSCYRRKVPRSTVATLLFTCTPYTESSKKDISLTLSTHQRPTVYSSYYSLILVSLYWAVLAVCYWLKKGSQLGGMARWEESRNIFILFYLFFFFLKGGDLCPAWWSCVLECTRTLRYRARTLEVNLFL